MIFQQNQYVKRNSGKLVKGILQNKAYKVEYSTNRWVKLYGVPKKYSTKYFHPANECKTDVLKYHLDNWKEFKTTKEEFISDRFRQLCELAIKHNASNFLTESITKNLIK